MTHRLEEAFAEASKLPPVEQDLLADRILADLRPDAGEPELTEAQQQDLDRRLAAHEANPADVLTWDEIKAHVRARR